MTQPTTLNSPLKLACGLTLKNRLVKAAMTERISSPKLAPTPEHEYVYDLWVKSGASLLITGNMVVDPNHLESAGNIYVGDDRHMAKLKRLATISQQDGTHTWVQLSHAGRQTTILNKLRPLAPSPIQLKRNGLFGKPRSMSEEDIEAVIAGFVSGAKVIQEAGFSGIQLHAAHGYLLSQFLSPNTNQRTDQWGGSLTNRSRLLIHITQQVRAAVGPEFAISVKLNSSDFQQGGLGETDALEVINMLDQCGIDLLEISGGTYEQLSMFKGTATAQAPRKESTRQREAYFLDFAQRVREVSNIPLMITGGFRTHAVCQEALSTGELDLVGMARPFLTDLESIPAFLKGEVEVLTDPGFSTGIRALAFTATGGYYAYQLIRLAKQEPLKLNLSGDFSGLYLLWHETRKGLIKRTVG